MQTTDVSNFFRSEAELIAEAARTEKAERTKTIGHPVELKGKVIRLVVRDGDAWTAESGGVVRRMDLATGRVVRVFKGHTGPVTCLAFFKEGENGRTILLSGAWDQTIRTWDAETGALISTTNAHSDFLKSLLVIPHLNLLVSGSSDKHIKLWDLTRLSPALVQLGASTAHTRPVECLATDASRSPCRLYSGDSMGVIKAWDIESHAPPTDRRRLVSVGELRAHTMGVTDMWAAHGRVWSASTDNTVRVQSVEHGGTVSIEHPTHVRSLLPVHLTPAVAPVVITGSASGAIHIWDVEGGEDISTIDGRGASANGVVDVHSHDVSALALWVRNPATEKIDEKDGIPPVKEIEAWVVSGSLDGTLRRWKLDDLVDGKHNSIAEPSSKPSNAEIFAISEEEERELAELMSDEDC